MGSKDDIMQHFIENDVRRHFPECQGWKIASREIQSGYDQVIRVERWNDSAEEKIVIGFSFEPIVPKAIIDTLRNVPASVPANSKYFRKAVLVPQGSDISMLPPKTEVFLMKSFVYKDCELIWLKHPSQRIIPKRQVPVPENAPATPVPSAN